MSDCCNDWVLISEHKDIEGKEFIVVQCRKCRCIFTVYK